MPPNQDFSGGPVAKTSPSNARGMGLILGWGTKIPHATQPKNQNIKQKQYCDEVCEDFKNDSHNKNAPESALPKSEWMVKEGRLNSQALPCVMGMGKAEFWSLGHLSQEDGGCECWKSEWIAWKWWGVWEGMWGSPASVLLVWDIVSAFSASRVAQW